MQTTSFTHPPGLALAVILTLVVAPGLWFGPEARAGDGRGLEGTWLLEATLVDCDTGAPLPIPGNPFPALHTYRSDGTMLDAGTPPPEPTAVTRSSAHGIWERTGHRAFRVRFRFFGFDAVGVHASTIEVTLDRRLIQGKYPETDEITGAATVQFFTASGDVFREGCGKDTGRRFVFEE